ncbi:MAG: hypothetical protein AAF597_21105, partial [Bacteroidota bacterium]
MDFQAKQALIRTSANRLMQGGTWANFQRQLEQLSAVQRREANVISVKVLRIVEQRYGPELYKQLKVDPGLVTNPGLGEVVFNKVLNRQKDAFRNALINTMARQLRQGMSPEAVFA